MKNNTANNETAPGGKMPGARIYKTRLINPKGKEVIEHIVGAARGWWKACHGNNWKG